MQAEINGCDELIRNLDALFIDCTMKETDEKGNGTNMSQDARRLLRGTLFELHQPARDGRIEVPHYTLSVLFFSQLTTKAHGRR